MSECDEPVAGGRVRGIARAASGANADDVDPAAYLAAAITAADRGTALLPRDFAPAITASTSTLWRGAYCVPFMVSRRGTGTARIYDRTPDEPSDNCS